jgi:cell division protein FtsB
MQAAERPSATSPSQIRVIVAIIVVLYFTTSLMSRVIDLYQLKQREAALVRANQMLVQKTEQKVADIRYFKSDSFIEKMARPLLQWGRPGEKLLSPAGVLPATTATPAPTHSP